MSTLVSRTVMNVGVTTNMKDMAVQQTVINLAPVTGIERVVVFGHSTSTDQVSVISI